MSASQLRQRERQVQDLPLSVGVVRDDPKEATFASLCCLPVEAYMDLANRFGQRSNDLGLHKVVESHHKARHAVVTIPERAGSLRVRKLNHGSKRAGFKLVEWVIIVNKLEDCGESKALYAKISKLISCLLTNFNTSFKRGNNRSLPAY